MNICVPYDKMHPRTLTLGPPRGILLNMQLHTVELQWLEHLLKHGDMFETGSFELTSVKESARSGGIIRISF